MSRDTSGGRWLERLTLASAAVFVVVTMGSSLIGLRTFTVTDLLGAYQPWQAEQSQDWTIAGARFADHINVILPDSAEFAERLRDGDLAWWSPYNNGGGPLASINEASVVSPFTWPYVALPLWLAPVWSHLLVMLVTVAGTVLFLRRLGISTAAGLVAGFAFVTSGFMYLHVLWPHTKVAAFLPWMFWAVERAVQQRRATSVVPIALVTALVYAGGFPAVAAFVLGAGVLYGGFRLVQIRREDAGFGGREAAGVGARSLAAMLLGLGLVAWMILPFDQYIAGIGLDYREQTTECHAPEAALASVIFPRYGSDATFGFDCPTGEHETDAFAGAMVLGLAGLGFLAPGRHRRGLRTFFAAIGALSAVLAYFGGPLLWIVQRLPVFEDNRIMRIRVLLAFALAVLAALGVDRLREELREPAHRRALAVVAGVMGVAALAAVRMHTWPDIPSPPLGGWVPFLACLLAAGVFLAARDGRSTVRRAALAAVPLLVGAEAVAAIAPYWPTGDPDDLYPETSTTEFLADNLGDERFAATGRTLLPNSNRLYGLRSLTGRSFYEDEWKDLLDELNRDIELDPADTRTTSLLGHPKAETAASPILDRLGVRYFVEDARYTFGELRRFGGRAVLGELRPDEPVVVPLVGPVRSIGFEFPVAPDPGGDRPRVRVELIDADGDVVGTGTKRVPRKVRAGRWHVPVAGGEGDGAVDARIRLVGAEHPLAVATYAGQPVAFVHVPADDGLDLVHADATVIYERDGAAPRIRWASDAVVETDPERRVELVADPDLPVSTVVLTEDGPSASGEPADVEVVEDGGDRIRATVDAEGAGYLVVADALQRGWRAEVDGEPVELRAADHAVVAVAVPEGTHEVALVYEVPGFRTGVVIAGVSAVALAGLALAPVGLHRRTGRASARVRALARRP